MIASNINAVVCKHEVLTGRRATKLYLGRTEFEDLKSLAWRACSYRMERNLVGDQRPEYCGMKIYEVDDESYLSVGL